MVSQWNWPRRPGVEAGIRCGEGPAPRGRPFSDLSLTCRLPTSQAGNAGVPTALYLEARVPGQRGGGALVLSGVPAGGRRVGRLLRRRAADGGGRYGVGYDRSGCSLVIEYNVALAVLGQGHELEHFVAGGGGRVRVGRGAQGGGSRYEHLTGGSGGAASDPGDGR